MEPIEINQNRYTEHCKLAGNLILIVLVLLIGVIITVCLIGAYYNYKEHTIKIENTVVDIAKDVEALDGSVDIQKKNEHFIEYLKEIAKGTAQTGNISFLFTVFSIAIVSASAYLLERSRQNVEMANKRIQEFKVKLNEITSEAKQTERMAGNAKKMAERANLAAMRSEISFRVSSLLSRGTSISWQLREYL